MLLIVGLGNPGGEYKNTRHNIGFEIVDSIHQYFSFPVLKSKFDGLYSKKKMFDEDIILFKPQRFMNLSGHPIKKIRDFYKINDVNNLIVFQDDLDMGFLKIRIKNNGGHGGHNGVKDLIKFNGSKFNRVKLGIKNKLYTSEYINPEKFVLDNFSNDEKKKIDQIKSKINENFNYIIKKEFSIFINNISENKK